MELGFSYPFALSFFDLSGMSQLFKYNAIHVILQLYEIFLNSFYFLFLLIFRVSIVESNLFLSKIFLAHVASHLSKKDIASLFVLLNCKRIFRQYGVRESIQKAHWSVYPIPLFRVFLPLVQIFSFQFLLPVKIFLSFSLFLYSFCFLRLLVFDLWVSFHTIVPCFCFPQFCRLSIFFFSCFPVCQSAT